MTDERIICIKGYVMVWDEKVDFNVALKFDEGQISEKLYEAIKGRKPEDGIPFCATLHDGCFMEIE